MRPAFPHPALLGRTVLLWVRSGVIYIDAHAPAAAKDAVVALHQRAEPGPLRLIEGLQGVRRFAHDPTPTSPTPRASSSRTSGADLSPPPHPSRPPRPAAGR